MGGKSSCSGVSVANTASRDLGGVGSIDKPVAFLSHDRILASKFELTGDPLCLIATILKDFHVAFRVHGSSVAMPKTMC